MIEIVIQETQLALNEIAHNTNVHLMDLFKELNVQLLPDYKFDREEANSR